MPGLLESPRVSVRIVAMGSRPEYLSRMVPIHARGDAYLQYLALFAMLSALWVGLGFTVLRNRRPGEAE
jgi:hypothetical protein